MVGFLAKKKYERRERKGIAEGAEEIQKLNLAYTVLICVICNMRNVFFASSANPSRPLRSGLWVLGLMSQFEPL
jgi:hypothetical protein